MENDRKIHILWTSSDPLTAQFMVLMYAANCLLRGWADEVTVIIWGGAAKLAAENDAVRERIKIAQHAGVFFTACVACARELGKTEELEQLSIELKPWGEPLTELITEGRNLITV